MNTRPSNRLSRLNKSCKDGSSLNRAANACPTCLVHRTPKRWQPKQRRSCNVVSRKPVELSQTDRNTLLRQQAMNRAQQGDRLGAIEIFNELIERHPDNATDYNNRGLVYFQNGQLEEAIADYDTALDLNPCLDSVYNNRANYYVTQGLYLDAILDYEMALELNPSNVRAWINQGITFRDLQMYDRAVESFDLGLHLGRLEGHLYAERGRTYHLWGDWNCAAVDYQRAIDCLPESAASTANPSVRLRQQVEIWLDELLRPLEF
jgi:tetratricopeptide (TPR) repeat protein